MALKPCRECRKEVSTQAKTCPQCGVPHPTSQLDPGTKQALGYLALIIVIVVIVKIGSESSAPPTTNNASTATPNTARSSPTRKRPVARPSRSNPLQRAQPHQVHIALNGDHWFGCMD